MFALAASHGWNRIAWKNWLQTMVYFSKISKIPSQMTSSVELLDTQPSTSQTLDFLAGLQGTPLKENLGLEIAMLTRQSDVVDYPWHFALCAVSSGFLL